MEQPYPALHVARTREARVLRLLSRESECSGALACEPFGSRLRVGGRSGHVAPRPCAEGEGPFAGALPLHMIWTDYNQRGTASTRRKLACCASSQETASTVARLRARHAKASFCVRGLGWHVAVRPCAEGERPLAGVVGLYSA